MLLASVEARARLTLTATAFHDHHDACGFGARARFTNAGVDPGGSERSCGEGNDDLDDLSDTDDDLSDTDDDLSDTDDDLSDTDDDLSDTR